MRVFLLCGEKMPKKDRTSHVSDLLPEYDASARFCYFYDLYSSARKIKQTNKPLARKKIELYNDAKKNLLFQGKQVFGVRKNNKNEVITSAINFLKKAAESERMKEVSIVTQYAEEIINKFKDNKSEEIKKIIKSLEDYAANPHGFAKGEANDFYTNLTLFINMVRQEKEDLEERISQLLSTNRNNMRDLASNQYLFRLPTDIDGIIRNTIGLKASEHTNSLASRVQELVIKYITKNIDAEKLIHSNPLPSIIALMVDFMHYLQQQFNRNKDVKKLEEIADSALEEIFNSYIEQEDNKVLKTITGETEERIQQIQDIATTIGLKQIKSLEELEARKKELKKRQDSTYRRRKAGKSDPNKGKEMIIQAYGRKFYNEYFKNIQWNVSSGPRDTRHGIIYEAAKAVIEGGYQVGGRAAIDRLYFPIAEIEMMLPEDQEFIKNGILQMKKAIKDSAERDRKDRLDDQTSQISEMNKTLLDLEKEINNIVKKYENVKNLFIYHESLKLYARLEEHKMGKDEGLKGRELTILSALDRLYTLTNIEDLQLLDKDVLYSIAINLANGAVASNLKESIENYLSIFAGMLMFDDIQNIATDIARQANIEFVKQNHVKQIHLYLINDMYFPSSMILTYIAEALNSSYNKITSNDTIVAEIDTSAADSDINTYLESHPYGSGAYNMDNWQELWTNNANKISSDIKVQIYFLASFISFIRDFQEQLQAYN